jgi:predicted PurR-regulated permease PerM
MAMDERSTTLVQQDDQALARSAEQSRAAWRRFGLRLSSVTPKMLARFGLVVGLLALIAWLVSQAWIALLPFLVGGVIAYALLPLVNRLDHYMPRFLAVLLALLPVAALGALFAALLIPTIATQLASLIGNLPGRDELDRSLAYVRAFIDTLPPQTRANLNNALTQLTAAVQARASSLLTQSLETGISLTLGLFNALGFLLGFLVVPGWVLTVLTEQQRASHATRHVLPEWMRADAWAVIRIVDRSLGWFVRGQVLSGIVAGFLVYGGLALLVQLFGLPGNLRYQVLLALFAGLMQIIPIIGPLIGAVPAIIVAFMISPQVGLAAIVVFVAVQWILENLVGTHLQRRMTSINANILV